MEVLLLQHVYEMDGGEEDVKTIDIYSTSQLADGAVERMRAQPGFKDARDSFNIDFYRLNEDHRTKGYVTVQS